jgi:hypothetical protein
MWIYAKVWYQWTFYPKWNDALNMIILSKMDVLLLFYIILLRTCWRPKLWSFWIRFSVLLLCHRGTQNVETQNTLSSTSWQSDMIKIVLMVL